MGRRKVRNYNGMAYYKNLIEQYFRDNADAILTYTVGKMGFKSAEDMRREELTGCWFDCGYVMISPTNKEQWHEWWLDNGKINASLGIFNPAYNTQSVTIQEIMVEKALIDLGLMNDFNIMARLD